MEDQTAFHLIYVGIVFSQANTPAEFGNDLKALSTDQKYQLVKVEPFQKYLFTFLCMMSKCIKSQNYQNEECIYCRSNIALKGLALAEERTR